ncbi:hypothetical protein [Microbacterium stercoris]|uniref:Uncharacterized protein n=1 Tax=Microbacterium stercoris TaxID=2820289 RepID=A0A939QIC4_9MICO|nr:hypothetical protein [Microbacterium stercoris]MBO3662615.1 hypothetical protein [Microbacterium stercoris]
MSIGTWFRRNALPLGALLVLLPSAVIVVGGQEWITYYGYRPTSPIEVPEGESATFGGAEFAGARLTDETNAHFDDVPPDARLLVARFDLIPADQPDGCEVTLREDGGAGRHWIAQTYGSIEGDFVSFCDSSNADPHEISAPFLVPADAEGPFFIEVVVADEAPRFLRLSVP